MDTVTTITGQRHVSLASIDPDDTGELTEAKADVRLGQLCGELRELHDLLMGAESHGVLVVLQGMDAAGKDVTIEHVFAAMNPQAFRVKAFSAPTEEEAKHHFLWRADVATPMRGEVVVFDRSYYEQAMPSDLPQDRTGERRRRRFEHINAWERILFDEGVIVIKVLLHVGIDRQEARLLERQEDLASAWKISADDWQKREDWDEHLQGYEDLINACATEELPWHVVPANHHWFSDVAIAELMVERLSAWRDEWLEAREANARQKQQEARAARAGMA